MKLHDMVLHPQDRSLIATTVWIIFNADQDAFKLRLFFVTLNFRGRVRRWIEDRFGPDPLDIESIRARS